MKNGIENLQLFISASLEQRFYITRKSISIFHPLYILSFFKNGVSETNQIDSLNFYFYVVELQVAEKPIFVIIDTL